MISDADVARYEKDRAVCLCGAVPGDWIERLRAGIDADIASPGPMKRINSKPGRASTSRLWISTISSAVTVSVMIGRSGFMTHAETEKSINLLAREVLPRLKEIALVQAGFNQQ